VFNILHGRGGEDGVLQGALEALRVPYTGSGVLGSALTMDKMRTKQVWQALGTADARFRGARARRRRCRRGDPGCRLPVPSSSRSREGSSVGVTACSSTADVAAAVELAQRYDGELLVEQMIVGPELTVGILDGRALPSIRIVPAGEFYDYHSKYISDDTRYICPAALPIQPRPSCARCASAPSPRSDAPAGAASM
jgi:D-alanine-D-alanine ligase